VSSFIVLREFSSSIGAKLQEIEASAAQKAPAAKSESKVVSVVSSSTGEKKTLGPLKTSRAGEPQSHSGNSNQGPQKAGSSRLLQSALQSSRGGNAGPNTGRGYQQQPQQHNQLLLQGNRGNFEQDRFAGQKSGGYDNNGYDNNGYDNNKKVRGQGGFNDNSDRRVVSNGPMGRGGQFSNAPPPAANFAPANDTVQFFEQMNKVAQASGFRNAQEMIASQKEMMAMMHGAVPMPMGAPPAPVPFAAPYPMQAPFAGGPPPPPGYPPQQGYNGFQGRGGRGFARGGFPFEGGRHWEGGRGGGVRGPIEDGKGAAVPELPGASLAPSVRVPLTSPYVMQERSLGGPSPSSRFPPRQGYNEFQDRGGRGFIPGRFPFEGGGDDLEPTEEGGIAAELAPQEACADGLHPEGVLSGERRARSVVTMLTHKSRLQQGGPEFLIVLELPERFYTRYAPIPKEIFIRNCYRELYQTTTARMLDPTYDGMACLFTGVPGIGKSLFLIYFIMEYFKDSRFTGSRVAFEPERGEYHIFKSRGGGSFEREISIGPVYAPLRDLLLLSDVTEKVEPAARARWTLIFSSPDPARFKERMKGGVSTTFTMPTWDAEEFEALPDKPPSWRHLFSLFGGVPRHVLAKHGLNEMDAVLEEAIERKGSIVAENFFRDGLSGRDCDVSYLLLHINPPRSEVTGAHDYAGRRIYTFASCTIFKRIASLHRTRMLAAVTGLFNASANAAVASFGASSAGHFFEKVCLWLSPLDGKTISVKLLEGGGATTVPARIKIPHEEILKPEWRTEGLLPERLYKPDIANLESGDAFFLAAVEGAQQPTYRLVIIQITVGENHPIKGNGITSICGAFSQYRAAITEKWILFVTPTDGRLKKAQPYHTQDNKVYTNMPAEVREFAQLVYRHRIDSADRALPAPGEVVSDRDAAGQEP
jgi:hypothetical protein